MNPDSLIEWAVCLGLAWIIFSSLTGTDVWLRKKLGGKDKTEVLEQRIAELEKRLDAVEKK